LGRIAPQTGTVCNWANGDLLHLTCNDRAVTPKEGVTAANIENLNVRVTSGKVLRDALKEAVFVFSEDLVNSK
jgi:hypothetical protein